MRRAKQRCRRPFSSIPRLLEPTSSSVAAFNQMKKYAEAEKSLNQGLELDPDSAAGHYELAKIILMALGQSWQDAEPHAVKALAQLLNVLPIHVIMGNILLEETRRARRFARVFRSTCG